MDTEFTSLLRKGIGQRSILKFSAECGISREHISRLLSGREERPRESTLIKLASAMEDVTLKELMDACGYKAKTPEEVAESVYGDVKALISAFSAITVWSSLNELLRHIEENIAEDVALFVFDEKEINDYSGVQIKALVSAALEYDGFLVCVYFTIDYTKAKIIPQIYCHGIGFPEKFPYPDWNKENSSRILKKNADGSLSGRNDSAPAPDGIFVYETVIGFGFYFGGICEDGDFIRYVEENKSFLCVDMESSKIYEKLINGGKDALTDSAWIPGEIAAKILGAKTKEPFYYVSGLGNPVGDYGCVFAKKNMPDKESARFLSCYVWEAAKALHVKKFGTVACTVKKSVSPGIVYNTETFDPEA